MAKNPKCIRKWIKEEKRIVALLYSRGLLKDWKIDDLYWASYKWLNKKHYRTKDRKYRRTLFVPEVHFFTSDYWGEGDEHSLVGAVIDTEYWSNIDAMDLDEEGFPKSKFPRMNRIQYINYLKAMPKLVCDKKINRVLKIKNDGE